VKIFPDLLLADYVVKLVKDKMARRNGAAYVLPLPGFFTVNYEPHRN
jgi:hypothetical protein